MLIVGFAGEDIGYVLLSIENGSIATGPFDKNALIAEKYDLGFCSIPKIMSTVNLAVFCFINRPNVYWRRKRRISTELRRHRSIKKLNASAKVDKLTYHLAPLTWYCNFKDELRSYKFIKYVAGPAGTQEIARQYDKLFEFSRVEQCLRQEVKKELLGVLDRFLR
ncbi:unnamed protein product [Nippostrongylus brasiliensis]|uniref:Glycosyltransferase n=1 Tax=Nippostrongylus brasiliensis TaxID=27835 RepID=A0A0N4XYY0_NIPBR|nr:unnamed protein product [Nippostrongylus brasiliensis]